MKLKTTLVLLSLGFLSYSGASPFVLHKEQRVVTPQLLSVSHSGFDFVEHFTNSMFALADEKNPNKISVYPNPAKGDVSVSFNNVDGYDNMTLNIVDFTGKSIMAKVIALAPGSNNILLETSALTAGVYIINATVSGTRIGTIKLVIRP